MSTGSTRIVQKIAAARNSVAQRVSDQFFLNHPDWLERYGQRGRDFCTEDARFHLDFLCGAIEAGSPESFADYALWTARMLSARGIAAHSLEENFGQIESQLALVLTADEIAQTAEFFSFGTNDLTQTCLGMSRDDSGSFLGPYQELEIVKKNPFATIDQSGVGQLITMAVEKGNKTRPGIKLGICGEHGGDPDSVKFCHHAGLTYVSCSPFRVPVARLAAAQAAVEEELQKKQKRK